MKELSIEQKAKAYDNALERAKEKYPICYSPALLEYIFPELKEDDGEKTKKWILEYLYDGLRKSDEQFKDHFKTAIAWLKKQNHNANKEYWRGYREGKQEILDKYAELEKQGEQNPTDRVEPKFHEGDWIVSPDNLVCKITHANSHSYTLHLYNNDYRIFETESWYIDKKYHLWTIADARDGDVLVSRSPFIYGKQCPYGGLNWCNNKFIKASNFIFTDSPVHPATKEQRDLLFQKMKEEGYVWDSEKKEIYGYE